MGRTPYLEASVGLENIFKILRIDYYRRLTYLDQPNIKKGGRAYSAAVLLLRVDS